MFNQQARKIRLSTSIQSTFAHLQPYSNLQTAAAKAYVPYTTATISEPGQYAQFKQRKFAADYDYVHIEAGAHPHLLGEPKYFWDASNHIIDFRDVDYKFNYVTLQPTERKAIGVFHDGYNMTIGLPNNFVDYTLTFRINAFVTGGDIDAMLQWQAAEHLAIHDECNVAYELFARADEMGVMRRLETLRLDIQRSSMAKIHLAAFMVTLPRLERLEFRFRSVDQDEIDAYLDEQAVPADWTLGHSPEGMAIFVRELREH